MIAALLLLVGACGMHRDSAHREGPATSDVPRDASNERQRPYPSVVPADAGTTSTAALVDPGPYPESPQATPPSEQAHATSPRMRCTLRVSKRGIYVDGDPVTRTAALALCKRSTAAMVVLEDDAPRDLWQSLKADLRHQGTAILMRGPVGHDDCMDNPLAKGCQ